MICTYAFVCEQKYVLKFLYYSSYILVMIAMDRFQAVCYPMNNHFWQPTRSKLKIVIAWILACIMCIPQAILFVETDTDHGTKTCTAQIGNNTSTGGKLSTVWPCLGHQYVSKKVRTKWNSHLMFWTNFVTQIHTKRGLHRNVGIMHWCVCTVWPLLVRLGVSSKTLFSSP